MLAGPCVGRLPSRKCAESTLVLLGGMLAEDFFLTPLSLRQYVGSYPNLDTVYYFALALINSSSHSLTLPVTCCHYLSVLSLFVSILVTMSLLQVLAYRSMLP